MYPDVGQDVTQDVLISKSPSMQDRHTYGELEQVTQGVIQRVHVLLYGYVNGGHVV